MDRLHYALRMAEQGFPVFPLRPKSKAPYSDEGVTIATTDAATIRAWFAERRGMNYGISTTEAVVLDVDVKHGQPGLETLEALGAIPDTLQVRTPTGGMHIYLFGMDAGQSPIGPGVDVRSHNGYVVGPGSYVRDRRKGIDGEYEITHDREVAAIPHHIAARLRPANTRREIDAHPIGELDTETAFKRGVAYLETLDGAGEGSRDMTGYRVAAQLKDYGLSPEAIAELMADRWNYKNEPPLDDWELQKLANNAWAHGIERPGSLNPDNEFGDIDLSFDADLPPVERAPAESSHEEALAKALADFSPLDVSRDPETLPPRPWIVDGLLMRGQLTGLVAPGAVGKSTFALALAVQAAVGDLDPMGFRFKADEPVSTVFVSTEENADEIFRRLYGYCKHAGIDRDRIAGMLHIFTGDRFLAMRRDPKTRQLRATVQLAALESYVQAVGAGCLVCDPIVELHEGDENDNREMAAVMAALRGVVRRQDVAGLIAHHTAKAANHAGDANAGRGAGAFVNNTRLNFTLFRPTIEEATEAGLPADIARTAFRLDKSKGNYVPPGANTRWYRTVGVEMPTSRAQTETTHGLEMLDADLYRENMVEQFAAVLAPAVEASDDMQITLTEAARVIMEDPTLCGSLSEAAVKKTIERLFETPVTYGCLQMWIEAGTGARPRKVLKGVEV